MLLGTPRPSSGIAYYRLLFDAFCSLASDLDIRPGAKQLSFLEPLLILCTLGSACYPPSQNRHDRISSRVLRLGDIWQVAVDISSVRFCYSYHAVLATQSRNFFPYSSTFSFFVFIFFFSPSVWHYGTRSFDPVSIPGSWSANAENAIA